MELRAIPSLAAVSVAVVGGAFFGMFSCGGQRWHLIAFQVVLGALVVTAMAVPLFRDRPKASRAFVLALVVLGYFVAQAAVAPFYPSTPESVTSFGQRFMQVLEYGPC